MKHFLKISMVISLLVLFATIVMLAGCNTIQINGSGKITSRNFEFANFSSIKIGGGFEVEVKASSTYMIEVTADDNLLDYVYVKLNGDTFEIRMKPGSYHPTLLKAAISLPELRGLALADGSDVIVSGFESSNDLAIVFSDGSRLSGNLKAGSAAFTLSDGSRMELEGSASQMKINSSDGSRVDLEDFAVGMPVW